MQPFNLKLINKIIKCSHRFRNTSMQYFFLYLKLYDVMLWFKNFKNFTSIENSYAAKSNR